MKKLIAAMLALVSIVGIAATVRPPANPPPCKWAGEYRGMCNPTTWPKVPVTEHTRNLLVLTVETNYTFTLDQYSFDGFMWQGSIEGVVSTAGAFKFATNGATVIGRFGAYGTLSGSYVNPKVESGTFNLFRESVLPK